MSIDLRDKRSRHCSALCRDRDYVGSVIGTVRSCRWCGSAFSPSNIYCSKQCSAKADVENNREAYNRRNAERRARERGAMVGERFTRKQVFDRDGWICQLCLAPIDWNLSGRGRWAPALDHIVPLNHGGSHTWDNVQAAHSGCNARKHDRLDVVILAVPEVA